MDNFNKEYKELNNAQKQAVNKLDGPVLVIAGPGTGKTKLLSMRVANIMRLSDADGASILCLTFTNKAATNMRDRLQDLIGVAARDVMVKTFHSFAAEIMNIYPEYFWSGARLATAPDAVQLEIIESILSELPLDNPLALRFAGAYTQTKDVMQALKLAKEAGLTPEKLRVIIKANLAYIDSIEKLLFNILEPPVSVKKLPDLLRAITDLPDQDIYENVRPLLPLSTIIKDSLAQAIKQDESTDKTKHVGEWKKRWVQTVDGKRGMFNERRRNNWWLAVADVYGTYRAQLHQRSYYDYADMLVEVIHQLEQHPDLLANVQERFLYVLIDEFQDTNAAQLRLAHLVADHHTAEGNPNLMAVGDDDQSIFKFNGAELKNMLSFDRMYPATTHVVLTKNYRSSQSILNTAAKIIDQVQDRMVSRKQGISKNLTAENPPEQKGVIQHIIYQTREHQLSDIARRIEALRTKGTTSMTVLARSHGSLRQLASLLLAINVPVRYEQQNNILEHEAVVEACLIARVAVAIQAGDEATLNQLLAQMLRHPMWDIKPETLWQLATINYSSPHWLETLLRHSDIKLSSIGHFLIWLAAEAQYQPLPLVMEYILGLRGSERMTSPIKEYSSGRRSVSNDYLHALSAIQLLRTLVNEFSRGSHAKLSDFVSFIELNQNNEQIVTDESPFVSASNAVELLTVHKAKGLEFDAVFIIDAIEENWKPRLGGRKPPANLPLQPIGEDDDDYGRLMYVAATRARHTLIVSSYSHDHAGKKLLATPFIRNAIDGVMIEPDQTSNTIEVLEENLRWPRLSAKNEQAMLAAKLENYSLSVTNLLNFLDITSGGPDYFMERNILRLPEAKTASLAYGTAVHAALELAQRLTNANNFNIGQIMMKYEQALRNEYLPEPDFNRYLIHGQNVLRQLLEDKKFVLPKGSLPEQTIKDIRLDKATISGKLDRIDVQGSDHLIIVDYKTGKPLSSFRTKDQSKVVKAWKHRTQLIFYTLLAHRSHRFKNYRHVTGQMIYVEAESPRDLVRSYTPTDDDITRLEKLIMAVWRHVSTLNFPSTNQYSQDYAGIIEFEETLLRDI